MSNFKEKAKIFNSEIKKLNLSKEEVIEMFDELDEDMYDAMISGKVPYTDCMDKIANYISNQEFERTNLKKGLRISFRISETCQESSTFIEEIISSFFKESLKRNVENKIIKIKSIEHFKDTFKLTYPVTIENFIQENRKIDNFIVILKENNVGISGLSIKMSVNKKEFKCIYVNTNEPLGRQVFTFFHEIYHIYVDESKIRNGVHISYESKKIEDEAHRFANEIIIDTNKLIEFCIKENMSCHRDVKDSEIYNIQKQFGVTFQFVVYKINDIRKNLKNKEELGKISKKDFRVINKNLPEIPKWYHTYRYESKWKELEAKIQREDPSNRYNFPTDKSLIL